MEMKHCILYICDFKVKLSKHSQAVSTFSLIYVNDAQTRHSGYSIHSICLITPNFGKTPLYATVSHCLVDCQVRSRELSFWGGVRLTPVLEVASKTGLHLLFLLRSQPHSRG